MRCSVSSPDFQIFKIFQTLIKLTTPEIPQHTIMLLVCNPKILHKHCFRFSWGHFNFHEKLKTIVMQSFGAKNKEHYGMLWYFLEWSIIVMQIKLMLLLLLLNKILIHCMFHMKRSRRGRRCIPVAYY